MDDDQRQAIEQNAYSLIASIIDTIGGNAIYSAKDEIHRFSPSVLIMGIQLLNCYQSN